MPRSAGMKELGRVWRLKERRRGEGRRRDWGCWARVTAGQLLRGGSGEGEPGVVWRLKELRADRCRRKTGCARGSSMEYLIP